MKNNPQGGAQYMVGQSSPLSTQPDISPKVDAWRDPDYYPRPKESLKREIRERDNYTCQLCGKHPVKHVDHIVPLEISHDNSPENLRILCHRCNLITGKRLAKFQLSQAQCGT